MDAKKSIDYLEQAVYAGKIREEEIDARVFKILQAKEYLQLHQQRLVDEQNLEALVNRPYARALKKRLYSEAITVVNNKSGMIPLALDVSMVVQIGGTKKNAFLQELVKEHPWSVSYLSSKMSSEQARAAAKKTANTVLVPIFDMNKLESKNFGISAGTLEFLKNLQRDGKKIILVLFGSPYSVKLFSCSGHPAAPAIASGDGWEPFDKAQGRQGRRTIILAYEDDPDAQTGAARVLLGSQVATGQSFF